MILNQRFSFTLIIIFLFSYVSFFGHSGRTDAYGGHTNHKTGEYHYHSSNLDYQHNNYSKIKPQSNTFYNSSINSTENKVIKNKQQNDEKEEPFFYSLAKFLLTIYIIYKIVKFTLNSLLDNIKSKFKNNNKNNKRTL